MVNKSKQKSQSSFDPKKDQIRHQLVISDLGVKGDGISHWREQTVFLPYTLPGEIVEASLIDQEKGQFRGYDININKISTERIRPVCQHFMECGGCTAQHMHQNLYQQWKMNTLKSILDKYSFKTNILPLSRVPQKQRRRAQLKIFKNNTETKLGFHDLASHKLTDLQACFVLHPNITDLFEPLRTLIKHIPQSNFKARIDCTVTDTGLDLFIETHIPLDLSSRSLLMDFALAHNIIRLCYGASKKIFDLIIQTQKPEIIFDPIHIPFMPNIFLQPTKFGEKKIIEIIFNGIGKSKKILDLFAGCGPFSFALSNKKLTVHAYEGEKNSVEAALHAIKHYNLQNKLSFRQRDLFLEPLTGNELKEFDCAIFNPPRAGALKQAITLAKSNIPLIIGVSCNPATFVRDAEILREGGYILQEIHPIDQFLWSHHLELVAIFSKNKY
ncbi:MAG: methyltransferase [Alphaproteobacteria bacterium]|nr:methyltransferase [Alphaproteobacteria bacterium]